MPTHSTIQRQQPCGSGSRIDRTQIAVEFTKPSHIHCVAQRLSTRVEFKEQSSQTGLFLLYSLMCLTQRWRSGASRVLFVHIVRKLEDFPGHTHNLMIRQRILGVAYGAPSTVVVKMCWWEGVASELQVDKRPCRGGSVSEQMVFAMGLQQVCRNTKRSLCKALGTKRQSST
ncbi:hypothetical protein FA13DRAFT_196369 [Coprinellus micaceus]|uniref:Uncharacterized protein n=1 Tax=Coprinellus micaceus TaxID=71717 RepID=A0A4Y7TGG7_COPMI|nr:hypothetical protein FA13DRAFT_196369 [Coprinellus micaceus]